MMLCGRLGKLPDELLGLAPDDGGLYHLDEDRLDAWLMINGKRREHIQRAIDLAESRIADAKDVSAYQYVAVQILKQIALWSVM